jgi:hypothetical protein
MNGAPTPGAPLSRLGYRPELDGLRAIEIVDRAPANPRRAPQPSLQDQSEPPPSP